MHPQRKALHNELHARPSLYFDAPALVFHLAFLGGKAECNGILERLCPGRSHSDAVQGITQCGGHPLKWERHNEFFTLTLVVTCDNNELQWQALPEDLARGIEGFAEQRLGELRESHVDDCQRLGVFIERRFKPTVRYCAAVEQRLEQLAMSVANLGDLLQARVQVEMEDQNAEILRSLNARADAQIKIQRAVEGLSVIAITYYLLNLFKLLYSGLQTLGANLPARDALLSMAPPVLLIMLLILLRIRKAKKH
ncbi:hypothetical protein D3C71_1353550 [compost metagenome]